MKTFPYYICHSTEIKSSYCFSIYKSFFRAKCHEEWIQPNRMEQTGRYIKRNNTKIYIKSMAHSKANNRILRNSSTNNLSTTFTFWRKIILPSKLAHCFHFPQLTSIYEIVYSAKMRSIFNGIQQWILWQNIQLWSFWFVNWTVQFNLNHTFGGPFL